MGTTSCPRMTHKAIGRKERLKPPFAGKNPAPTPLLLNRQSKFVSKCRHENKFQLKNTSAETNCFLIANIEP